MYLTRLFQDLFLTRGFSGFVPARFRDRPCISWRLGLDLVSSSSSLLHSGPTQMVVGTTLNDLSTGIGSFSSNLYWK